MRIIAFSDLHSSTHDDFSYLLPNGMNSRLADCLGVIDRVMYYRDKYDCSVVLNAGDTFHVPAVMDTIVFQETYKRLEHLARTSKHMVVLAGNHDMAAITKDGTPVSTVYALGGLLNTQLVVGKYRPIDIGHCTLHCLPYIKDHGVLERSINQIGAAIKSRCRTKINIIVTHIGLTDVVNGPNEIELKGGYSIARLRKLGAHKILSGHHHHPQQFKSVDVIGSPLQHNMLDRGDRRGLLIYDTKTEEVTRIWLKNSRFFMYEVKSKNDFNVLLHDQEKLKGGYVRVMLDVAIASESKVVDIIAPIAKMYKVLPFKQLKSGIRSEHITQKAIANIGNMSAVVPDYVEHIDPPNLNRRRLIMVGKRLLTPLLSTLR